ncbi:hypothetical protein AB0368_04195 [Actinoplanes sp. NPDC051475]|uniref:hypothetical protein n=1 Tax=Actinoplanes sp. NPDC051475 TaxID=3157225 RepID=UPI00344C89F4
MRSPSARTSAEVRPDDLTLFTEIATAAHGRPGTSVRLVCFTGPSAASPTATGEIAEVAWFTAADAGRCASAIQQLIAQLVESGLMD